MTLEKLGDRYWDAASRYAPTVATVRGVHHYNDRLRSFEEGWLASMRDEFAGIARDTRNLSGDATIQDRITAEVLIYQCEILVEEIDQRYFVAPIDPFLGPHMRLLGDTRQNTAATPEHADALLNRYSKIPEYLQGAMGWHQSAADQGMTPAAASVKRVLNQLDGYLDSGLEDDPFLALGGADDAWLTRAEKLVTDVIRPAFTVYRDAMTSTILPVSRPDDRAGLKWMTNGEEIYESLIYKYTQTRQDPQEIHDIGQKWATEINAAEWVEIGGQAFGATSLEEVFDRLHSDPELRFKSEEHMLAHAREALERAWGQVDEWFGAKPSTPCDVVPVPPATAPAMPPAYYMQPPVDGSRPGRYFLNTFEPTERDLFEYESIHFHEGIPGHHFDRSLASELEGIPTFRRYAQVFAHTEGWGLYSERLADEMGLYSSEVDRLGMVAADAWRAGRLVTDTGIHALGWSRQEAIDFLSRWTPIGKLTIEQEVDRYIGMPAQALSYKIGQLEILRLRRLAEESLGDRFDIKGFHDTMLTNGAMPLPFLAVAVEDWIDKASAAG